MDSGAWVWLRHIAVSLVVIAVIAIAAGWLAPALLVGTLLPCLAVGLPVAELLTGAAITTSWERVGRAEHPVAYWLFLCLHLALAVSAVEEIVRNGLSPFPSSFSDK